MTLQFVASISARCGSLRSGGNSGFDAGECQSPNGTAGMALDSAQAAIVDSGASGNGCGRAGAVAAGEPGTFQVVFRPVGRRHGHGRSTATGKVRRKVRNLSVGLAAGGAFSAVFNRFSPAVLVRPGLSTLPPARPGSAMLAGNPPQTQEEPTADRRPAGRNGHGPVFGRPPSPPNPTRP